MNRDPTVVLGQMAMHSVTNRPAAKIHEAKYETGYMSILVILLHALRIINRIYFLACNT